MTNVRTHTIPSGVRYMAAGAFFFSLMSVLVKVAGERIPSQEIVFIRSALTLAIAYWALKHAGVYVWGRNKRVLVLRGLAGFAGLSCFYYALTELPLADATVIQYTNPVFTAVFAALFLAERMGRVVLGGMALSLLGVVLIAQPGFLFGGALFRLDPFAVSVALLGAIFSAVAYTIVRYLGRTEHPLVIVFYFPLISTPASVPGMLRDFVMPIGIEWLVLIGIGITTHLGQVFMTKGLQREKAGRATSISYLQMVFAFVWGLLLFGEFVSIWSYAGALLIIAGTLAIARTR